MLEASNSVPPLAPPSPCPLPPPGSAISGFQPQTSSLHPKIGGSCLSSPDKRIKTNAFARVIRGSIGTIDKKRKVLCRCLVQKKSPTGIDLTAENIFRLLTPRSTAKLMLQSDKKNGFWFYLNCKDEILNNIRQKRGYFCLL